MHLKIKFMITLELNKVVFKKTGLKLVICRSWVHGSFDLLVNNWVTLLHNKIVNDKNIKIDLYTGISFILIENTSQLFCQNIQNLVLREMLNNKNKCKCTFVHLGFGGLERRCFQSNLILCLKVEKEHDFPSSKTWHPPAVSSILDMNYKRMLYINYSFWQKRICTYIFYCFKI